MRLIILENMSTHIRSSVYKLWWDHSTRYLTANAKADFKILGYCISSLFQILINCLRGVQNIIQVLKVVPQPNNFGVLLAGVRVSIH